MVVDQDWLLVARRRGPLEDAARGLQGVVRTWREKFRGVMSLGGVLLLISIALPLCAVGVRGQYAGIPKYAKKEAALVTEGGCVLDCLAVYNRACALISETLPFYYLDEETQTMKVNESKAETNVRWICWGKEWTNTFAKIDPNAWVSYSEGLGVDKMKTACGSLN